MSDPAPVATVALVGLVFVSHSSLIAKGLVDLARQMAPSVRMLPAGGTDDDRIGTSFAKVAAGIEAADAGKGVVVLCDLGSAILTAESALDFLDDETRSRVVIADAPLVEGAVAAAVAAQIGGDLPAVESAARSARASHSGAPAGEVPVPAADAGPGHAGVDTTVTRTVTLINADGLHARPAAEFVTLAATLGVPVTVNGRDAASLLAIMGLGLTRGARVELSATGDGAAAAVDALATLIESGFGEA
ncbi:dihydroxyacetone kinase phosphoryl donor subunit DhaM [Cryobacterium zhongshanensis]|uniref:Phosphocarrier protein HPr n=1 Tax=Cryobacterium zhongshanensis TaxID=2928153 RepID=A0AA41QVB7_9MICO|nr:dihydroxyacetone kinase phosphoryl donor subunit DhaM [Cryobacterium zhongshanensis]MCI4657732.1 PTS-dependent dihydroxyacetone kinase phosphotransferase subunit DhaM [Cryobacterium zhongshanensis]